MYQIIRSYQSLYFDYWAVIISSAKCMKYKTELNKTPKQ